MNLPNACHVPDHHTDPLPITEVSTYMDSMDSLLAARQKQPTWKKIVRPQTRTMMEEETTMIGA